MPVKRRSVKKGVVRKLFANVARKKKRQRAATAASPAELEGDVPNLGVARALVVILMIHVVAIAGIFFHSHWIDGEKSEATEVVEKAAPVVVVEPTREDDGMPKIKSGDSIYTVGTGDTYENIAGRFGVTENELRLANDNIEIRAGRYLRIPPKKIVAVEPQAIAEVRARSNQPVLEPIQEVVAPALVDTEAALLADGRPTATADVKPASSDASASYTVKPGDTFWSISKRYGASVETLMKANGITDARRLRVGMSLTIPQ
ncbi:MAG: LysM peptidoglycan-binding domain-containing protein [Haloferula sp.]